jgi:hypothetical protein
VLKASPTSITNDVSEAMKRAKLVLMSKLGWL